MFRCKRIDQRDGGGKLVATGVEWTERKLWVDGVMMLVVFIGTMISMLALIVTILMTLKPGDPWWIPATVAAMSFSPWFWSHLVEIAGTPRQLLFQRDGRVTVPGGLPFHRRVRTLTCLHDEFSSIEVCQIVSNAEAQQTAFGHGVVMIMRDGGKVYIATKLHTDQALKVAVQLTQALAVMRDDVANDTAGRASRPAQPKAREAKRPSVEVMID